MEDVKYKEIRMKKLDELMGIWVYVSCKFIQDQNKLKKLIKYWNIYKKNVKIKKYS